MKKIVIVLLLVVSTAAFAQTKQEKPIHVPKIAMKIPLGETIETNGVSITFVEVLEDSRCPINVTCIWEGRVTIDVRIEQEGKETATEQLIFGATRSGEDENHMFYTSEAIKLEGMNVVPYPKVEEDKRNKGYTLLVCAYKN